MTNLILFGSPGAGKGTQAERLKEKYRLVHISTGVVFRENIKNETDLGKTAKNYIDNGELVPDEITIAMLEAEVVKHADARGFIFDGFPRTLTQARALDAFLEAKKLKIDATLALEVDSDTLLQRLVERGKTSGRSDDQDIEKIQNRFVEYDRKTSALKAYYTEQNKFYTIKGVGSIEEITQRLSEIIDNL